MEKPLFKLWLPSERNLREKLYKNLMSGTSLNPYATVSLEHLSRPSKRILKTRPIAHTTDPVWDHTQTIDVATNVSYLVIHVKSAPYSTQPRPRASLGFVRIKAEHVLLGVDGQYPLVGLHGIAENSKNRGTIRLSIRYLPIDSMPLLGQPSVPGTYFSACDACHVQLFQDAHCPAGAVLPIPGSSDALYADTKTRFTNYFETIYYSLMNAKKLIYISGWSVDTTLHLLRRHPAADPSLPLGELLKMKAAQGVVVLLMVWDELFSTSNPILRLKGIMDTRDEVTRAFFRNSGVKAAVVPRLGRLSEKVFQAPLVPCLFTFHEKLVITDVPTPAGKRELTAFCGGLDLTYGRWDTPAHAPFSTLDNVHATDFHNACFDVALPFGPREPWHDIAAMVTGPVVRDFVRCFEERWKRQGLGAAFLADLDSMSDVVDGRFEQEERWTVQVFRSIDERSAVFDKEWARKLETKKGRSVDRSIHHAYVHYTRAANRCKLFFRVSCFINDARVFGNGYWPPRVAFSWFRRVVVRKMHGRTHLGYDPSSWMKRCPFASFNHNWLTVPIVICVSFFFFFSSSYLFFFPRSHLHRTAILSGKFQSVACGWSQGRHQPHPQ